MQQGDLFKRLSLDESLRRVFDVYASGFCPFTKIAVGLVGVNAILWVDIFPFLLSTLNVTREDTSDPMFVASHTGKLFLLLGPNMMLSVLISHKAVADMYADHQPDWVASMKSGMRKAVPITVTSHLMSLLAKLAAVAGIRLTFVFYSSKQIHIPTTRYTGALRL
jgi:hypothetical protein